VTDHTLHVEQTDLIPTDTEGVFVWAAWGTLEDGTGIMGYGDSSDAAVADMAANAGVAFTEEPEPVVFDYTPPEIVPFVFTPPNLGTGPLAMPVDLLA